MLLPDTKLARSTWRRLAGVLGCLAQACCLTVLAQPYPAKPVRVVVPNAPGSLNDTVARLVFARVGEAVNQQFVIDNRPGAGGSIGAEALARAPGDGYSLLVCANTIMAVNPFLYAKVGYDPVRDFEPISMLVKIGEVLVVHPSLRVKTVDALVRLAKQRPAQINYASGGNGHPTHLMMELFQRKAGVQLVHVPYKGTTPAMQALVAGEVAAFNIGVGLARPHIKSGKVIALAKTGYTSVDTLPGVPALTAFLPDVEYVPWQAAFAPKGTPQPIVLRLNAEIGKALASPEIAARLMSLDLAPISGSPRELEQALRTDIEVNRALVKSLGMRLE